MKRKIVAWGISLFIVGLAAVGCSPVLGGTQTAVPDQGTSQVSDVVIPNWDIVEQFIANSSTFKFDGVPGSIKLVNSTADAADVNWEYTVEYQTTHAGHGDRTGHMMAQVITKHTAIIDMTNGEVISAVCDDSWDMLKDSPVTATPPDIQAALGEEFTLSAGQSAAISSEDLAIRFVEVTSDSRSPEGAETIWAGEATCLIQVTYQGATSEITLTEKGATEGFTQASVLQYEISFQLEPYPQAGYQPASNEYSMLIKITD